jgi:hypothetical protein
MPKYIDEILREMATDYDVEFAALTRLYWDLYAMHKTENKALRSIKMQLSAEAPSHRA